MHGCTIRYFEPAKEGDFFASTVFHISYKCSFFQFTWADYGRYLWGGDGGVDPNISVGPDSTIVFFAFATTLPYIDSTNIQIAIWSGVIQVVMDLRRTLPLLLQYTSTKSNQIRGFQTWHWAK